MQPDSLHEALDEIATLRHELKGAGEYESKLRAERNGLAAALQVAQENGEALWYEAQDARDLIQHLAGLTDLAGRYSVTKQAVKNWSTRNSDFPTPVLTLSAGSLWDEREVTAWRSRHRTKSSSHNIESEMQ